MVTMGGPQSSRMETDVWLTPRHILDALGDFDLDPCGAPGWDTARRHIYLPNDGLSSEWTGRVWLNPPYSREARLWIAKLARHGRGTALVFARTETSWFVDHIWERAAGLLFLYGRVRFVRPNGAPTDNAGAPSVLVAYGPDDAKRLKDSELNGKYVSL